MKPTTLIIVGLSINIFFGLTLVESICLCYFIDDRIRFVVTYGHIKPQRRGYKHRELELPIPSKRCPKCGSTHIIRWCSCSKTMYDKYRNPVCIEGVRIKCKSCVKTTRCYPPGIELYQRLLPETLTYLVTQKMFKKSGYRDIGREDYTKSGFSAYTCWNVVQGLGPKAKAILKHISVGWSDTLIVDETYEKCKGGVIIWIVAGQFFRDTNGHHYCCIVKTKTLYVEATEESRKDKRKLNKKARELLAVEHPVFFRELAKRVDDPAKIKAIVTDLENTYPDAIKKAFPNAKHQLCLEHAVDAAKRAFNNDLGKKNLTEKDRKLLKELYDLPRIKSGVDYNRICDHFQQWWAENEIRVRESREKKGKRVDTAGGIKWWHHRVLLKKESICAFLEVSNCPPTTNSLESQFSRLQLRTDLMKSFQSGKGAQNYLDLMAVYLDVALFSDGHNPGSSIIELAGITLDQDIFP